MDVGDIHCKFGQSQTHKSNVNLHNTPDIMYIGTSKNFITIDSTDITHIENFV